MKSIRAIADAFRVDSSELFQPAPKEREGPSPKAKGDVPRFLVRITSGADLFAIIGGAHAGSVENEEQARVVDLAFFDLQQIGRRGRWIPALLDGQLAARRAQTIDRQHSRHARSRHIGADWALHPERLDSATHQLDTPAHPKHF